VLCIFPNTSARNLCEGCWQTWASSHWRWQFYQSDHLCWQRMLHKLNQLCILLPEDRRMQKFFYTDQTLKIKKIQNKICYITAMLNVYLFCSHKDTFCWKIKGIPQHLDLEKCMTDQLLWALIRRASWPCAHPLSGPTSCTSLKESMLSFPSMKTMSYFWTRKKCQLSQYWIAFKILK
jgi:hypothetical protein